MTPTATSITMRDTPEAGFAWVDFSPITAALTSGVEYSEETTSSRLTSWSRRHADSPRLSGSHWPGQRRRAAVRPRHANRASQFLGLVIGLGDVPLPDIIPLADGGVQLEWHTSDGRRIDFVSDEDAGPVVLLGRRAPDRDAGGIGRLHATPSSTRGLMPMASGY